MPRAYDTSATVSGPWQELETRLDGVEESHAWKIAWLSPGKAGDHLNDSTTGLGASLPGLTDNSFCAILPLET
jgi:hypothetical protein